VCTMGVLVLLAEGLSRRGNRPVRWATLVGKIVCQLMFSARSNRSGVARVVYASGEDVR